MKCFLGHILKAMHTMCQIYYSNHTITTSQSVYIDDVEQTTGLRIQRNRRCAEYLSKLEVTLNENHEMQAPQIQGRGSGFHMAK
ncbi:MAG: hypothetical protein IJH12_06110 [Clostridia bacterium]|nr:hypothetical protein [Clostridia bacterium]